MMRPPERSNATLEALIDVGRNHAEPPSRAELEKGLSVVRARLEQARLRRHRLRRATLIAALLSAPLVWTFIGRWQMPEAPALTYEVQGGSVLEGGYLRETGDDGVTLSFSEGSRFSLAPGTRGRLRQVDANGARFGIENGSASFTVTPTEDKRWEVEVGPFLVTVKGTEFSLSWEPDSEQFELTLHRGEVVVSGPVSSGELTLRAGQRLAVDLRKAETLIARAPSSNAVAETSNALAPSSPAPASPAGARERGSHSGGPEGDKDNRQSGGDSTAEREAAGRPRSSNARMTAAETIRSRSWAEELANGRWDSILADVERQGIEATLESATSEDLFALANAARYRRRTDLALRALLVHRRRFPASARASDAVFLLGRVEEARGNGSTRAIARYDEYLSLAPTGAYAAEALGRKMTILSESGAARAERIAREYLRRFPKGSHAGSARALLDER